MHRNTLFLSLSLLALVSISSAHAQEVGEACDPETFVRSCNDNNAVVVCDDLTNPNAPVVLAADCETNVCETFENAEGATVGACLIASGNSCLGGGSNNPPFPLICAQDDEHCGQGAEGGFICREGPTCTEQSVRDICQGDFFILGCQEAVDDIDQSWFIDCANLGGQCDASAGNPQSPGACVGIPSGGFCNESVFLCGLGLECVEDDEGNPRCVAEAPSGEGEGEGEEEEEEEENQCIDDCGDSCATSSSAALTPLCLFALALLLPRSRRRS